MSQKILVVDDESDIRAYLRALLVEHDYAVVTATDGVEALEVARREKPDLICLDLHMPNRTGTEFYKRLIRDPELGSTPVIVVSGLAGREVAVSKPVAVFDKPIDREGFLEAVEKALG